MLHRDLVEIAMYVFIKKLKNVTIIVIKKICHEKCELRLFKSYRNVLKQSWNMP